jgi:hypothetical protein
MDESLKLQEDATKKGKFKESDQLKHRGVTSPLQGGWNNRNEPSKVDEKGAKTSCCNCILQGKEEITASEKSKIPSYKRNSASFKKNPF